MLAAVSPGVSVGFLTEAAMTGENAGPFITSLVLSGLQSGLGSDLSVQLTTTSDKGELMTSCVSAQKQVSSMQIACMLNMHDGRPGYKV